MNTEMPKPEMVPVVDIREVPEVPEPQGAKARAMAKWREQHDGGLLEALSPDEMVLLLDYRIHKVSADAAGGVFHWNRKNAMKRLQEAASASAA